jgi:hypothetical protein
MPVSKTLNFCVLTCPAPEPGTSLAYSQFATFALSMPMPMPARSTFVDDQG